MPKSFLLIGLAIPFVLAAPAPPRVQLGPATGKLDQEFSQVASMRELGDGRVLVTDFREQTITVGDFAKNMASTIGRRGDGPGEYVMVTQPYAFGKDSSLMVLQLAKRWTIITPDLKFSTVPPDAPMVQLAGHDYFVGSDALGHLLLHGGPARRAGVTRDTSPLFLLDWRRGKADTIARTDGGPAPKQQRPASGRDQINPYVSYDKTAIGDDGWIAIIRHDPYRVEWRSPSGRWTIGKVVDDAPVLFTSAERKAYMDRRAAARANASTKVFNAPGIGRTKEGTPPRPEPEFVFPDRIPPFIGGPAPLISPQGYLLVLRTATLADPGPLYDVFDRQGNRTYQLSMPSNQRPIAFGAKSLYVVTTDDDGIQRLSRHAWPVRR